ncbi:MAG: helix-turn-helix domain-containing protein [Paludibacteraceae bacterium]|nr:helix-turn-helix domain-containing protein [Paludibacteraceae bacterium]
MKENKDIKLVQLGQRLRDIRAQKDLTQSELAERSDVASNYIAMLERGERNPTYLTLLKIAQGCGVSICELVKE